MTDVRPADRHDLIRVQGARENNLKDVSVEIPKRRLTVFTELGRAGFRVDTILEPRPSTPGARIPDTIVWRARKEGA
jgi:hypothetical protein